MDELKHLQKVRQVHEGVIAKLSAKIEALERVIEGPEYRWECSRCMGATWCEWYVGPGGDNPYCYQLKPQPEIAEEPEYIEGDKITDAMLKGGRVPCEVSDVWNEDWYPAKLVLVYRSPNSTFSFVTAPAGPESAIYWMQCRIKKSDLP